MGEVSSVNFAADYNFAVMGKAMGLAKEQMQGAVDLIQESAPPSQGYGDVLDVLA
ncbi:MAG: hypothetical protein LBL80_00470 [Ruminococcus sp.]|jgi:hypothetical protein|nr:hypothetical protein [Ruminococcus sp.]